MGDKLEDKDCESVYEVVFHVNRSVSQAAGDFLNEKLLEKLNDSQDDDHNAAYIKLIIQFLIESELHDHPTYLIDSLWNKNDALKDWKCMTDLLLNKENDEQLDDAFECYLIEIITCCVQHASTGESPLMREQYAQGESAQTHTKLTQKEIKAIELGRVELTEHFIECLPQLIQKYNADADKLIFLLQIPTYFELKIYTNSRKEIYLDKLLDILQEIINKHTDTNVLHYCSACLAYLCNEDFAIYTKCNLIRSLIIDNLVNQFKTIMDSIKDRELDENELFQLVSCIKRLSVFSQNHNILNAATTSSATRETSASTLSSSNIEMAHVSELWKHIKTLLASCENNTLDNTILSCCYNLMRSILCWLQDKLVKLISNKYKSYYEYYRYEDSNVPGDESDGHRSEEYQEINDLIQYINKLFKKYFKYVNNLLVSDNNDISQESYLEICDLMILFNKTHFVDSILKKACVHLPHVNLTKEEHAGYKSLKDNLYSLILDCQPNDVNMLLMYCINNIFVNESLNTFKQDSAEKIENLHRRRCILSAFCKLIIYNTISIRYLTDLARSFYKYSNSYGDILKETIIICRDIDKISTVTALSNALQREFNEFVNENFLSQRQENDQLNDYEDYQAIRELARKFLSLFGSDSNKLRDVLIQFHIDSFKYLDRCINDTNYKYFCQYFSILNEFLSRLGIGDKKNLLNTLLLQKQILKYADKNSNNWKAYFNYRDNLVSTSGISAKQQVSMPQDDQQHGQDTSKLYPLSSTVLMSETKTAPSSSTKKGKRPSIDISRIQSARKQTTTKSTIEIVKSDRASRKRSNDELNDNNDTTTRIQELKLDSTATTSNNDDEAEAKSDDMINENELQDNKTIIRLEEDNDSNKIDNANESAPSSKRFKKASEPAEQSTISIK